MAVKKMVSNEPEWVFARKKDYNKHYVKVRSRHGKAVVARYTLERGMK